MKAPEFDADALLERIASVLGDCLAIGSLNRKTGALGASLARAERWAATFSRATSGTGPVLPGVRLTTIGEVLNKLAEGNEIAAQLAQVSLIAEDSRVVFQRSPWDEREVLFVVLPENGGAETNFALLRLVLESVRRDVAIIRAPRVEERSWN